MSGGGSEAGVKGGQAIVVARRPIYGGDADGSLVGRTDGGGGGAERRWRRIKLVGG